VATLDEGLALFAERSPPPTGFLADVKRPGHESTLVEALRRHGLVDRTAVSSFDLRTLRAVRRLEPRLVRSRTYPMDRLGVAGWRVPGPAVGWGRAAMRRALSLRIGRLLAAAGAGAGTIHHALVSRALVERCHAIGAAVLAWTVDDRSVLARLDELGVDGVITNDPRIFRPDRAATLLP
jgi:glycerophosphoryl diester phosphodiesterase